MRVKEHHFFIPDLFYRVKCTVTHAFLNDIIWFCDCVNFNFEYMTYSYLFIMDGWTHDANIHISI